MSRFSTIVYENNVWKNINEKLVFGPGILMHETKWLQQIPRTFCVKRKLLLYMKKIVNPGKVLF